MRDLLDDLQNCLDPHEAARASQQRPLPRRFYKDVTLGEAEDGFRILLDGRPVRTPARAIFAVPSRELGEAVADEWRGQEKEINPHLMPLTRLINVALDGVARDPEASALDWLRQEHGARFVLSAGIVHVAQPEESLARIDALVPRDALRLTALVSLTSLLGSALLSLALFHGRVTPAEAWAAAHVDEDWNIEQWGEDDLAASRRAARQVEMQAAADILRLLA
ncbi:MAG: hypothetical protein B7Y84_16260 [Azorhizobium sp. 32-67-21]|nr:MAG: hypothetical protein B7Y84_16260 [Azorhizobium sp. 32-67-21]